MTWFFFLVKSLQVINDLVGFTYNNNAGVFNSQKAVQGATVPRVHAAVAHSAARHDAVKTYMLDIVVKGC